VARMGARLEARTGREWGTSPGKSVRALALLVFSAAGYDAPMLISLRFVAIFLVAACAVSARANGLNNQKVLLQGRVTHVSDGDTLWILTASGERRKLRLEGIDAPELCQAHGPNARDALRQRLQWQSVQVQGTRRDDYGRQLARLQLGGEDIGAWLVQSGHAWSYRYRRDDGPYAVQEREARAAHRGLFAQAKPERPADFRKRNGPCVQPE
jgi:micrococcal nuclease